MNFSSDLQPELTEGLQAFARGLLEFIGLVQEFRRIVAQAAIDAEKAHRRAELLRAYKMRRQWKVSDIPRLEALGVNPAARKRMERLRGRGRGVVPAPQPLWLTIAQRLHQYGRCVEISDNPDSSMSQRVRAIKAWPWWPHYVEALYRGEHELARKTGIRCPAIHAEETVGRVLGISGSAVRKLCAGIRRERRRWSGAANSPAMTLAQFANLQEYQALMESARH